MTDHDLLIRIDERLDGHGRRLDCIDEKIGDDRKHRRKQSYLILAAILTLLTILLVGGCGGAKGKIMAETHAVDVLADAIHEDIETALFKLETGVSPVPELRRAQANAVKIKAATRKVRKQLPKTENVQGTTVRLLLLAGKVALIAGVLALLWYFGVGKIVRPLTAKLGWWISSTTKAEAKLHAEAINDGAAQPALREAVAARRAADPAYNAEFERQHK